ncbi:MAG: flagellar biosynthesis protein FlhF [Candidatus Cloacimonetes bacterium]|nr:flagellar biosynthesis protein FlhF [Candidatus Cloacimonadota bacterium]
MKIKKFIAPSMQEALKQIKKEFGDDAIILSNRSVEHSEWKSAVEITAAIDKKDEPQAEKVHFQSLIEKPAIQPTTSNIPTTVIQTQLNSMSKDIEYLRDRIEFLINHIKYEHLPHIPKNLQDILKILNKNGVNLTLANNMIEEIFTSLSGEELMDEEMIMKKLNNKIKHFLNITGPIKFNQNQTTVVLLMGPTGSGKTTTIAKLAALYKYTYSRKVALVSADSFRIAAMEQLKAFAEIAKIPFVAVYNNNDLTEKINSLRKYELILIDTTGLNAKNMKQMISLKETIRIAKADEIHLTLSMTTKYSDLSDNIKNFNMIPYDGIILTKMDETEGMGDIVNIAADFEKPYSYITFGQDIPDDISLANRNELAQIILRGKHGN